MANASSVDTLVYTRADGTRLVLVPRDQRFGWPANRDVDRVLISRPGSPTPGEWVPEGSPDVLLPVPPGPADGPLVEPGQSWADALRSAAAGTTVYLRAGQTYAGPGLTDPNARLRTGVKLAVWPVGQGKATVRVLAGTALALWAAAGFTATDLRFTADAPTDGGVRFMAGCRDVGLVRCEVAGFTFGVTTEGTVAARNVGVTLDRCYVHDNWHPANQDSSGLFAAKTDRLILTNCLFERNGWCDGHPAARGGMRNHNAYVAGDCGAAAVTGCAFAAASSHGLQARSGGRVEGNWFADNPIHLSVGLVNGGGPVVPGGVRATVRGNTFCGTRPLAGAPRGWAVEVGNALDVTIADNTFARDGTYDARLGNFPAAVKVDVCDLDPTNPDRGREIKVAKLLVANNACRWPFAALWRHPGVPPERVVVDPPAWGQADPAAVAAATLARLTEMRASL